MKKLRIMSWIMTFIILLGFMYIPIQAKERIKVGCVDLDNFLNIEKDGTVNGYGVDFLSEISKYTNWDYEYIKGNWEECLAWLQDGTIDLLMPAQYSKERSKEFLYSEKECCKDYVALICLDNRDDLYFNDPKSYNELNVGMIKGNYLNTIFEDYVLTHELNVKRQYYDNLTSMNNALESQEVDLIVNGSMNNYNQKKYIAKLGLLPAYFITSQKNAELMKRLNQALSQIELNNPYYVANLHEKHYGDNARKSIGLTKTESEFIQNHSQLTVVCDLDDSPLEYFDKEMQSYKGILIDYLELMSKNDQFTFKVIPTNKQNPWQMVKDKKADIVLSATASTVLERSYQMHFSDSYYTTSSSLVARKQQNIDVDSQLTIAMVSSQPGIMSTALRKYPQWHIQDYASVEDCLNALNRKEVDGALLSTLYLHMNKPLVDYPSLVEVLPKIVETPISLGVHEDTDPLLMSVLNKAIHKISENDMDSLVISNMLDHQQNLSFQSILQQYPFQILLICGIIIGLVIFVILQARYSQTIVKKNRELEDKNLALKNAKELEHDLKEQLKIDDLSGLLNKANVDVFTRNYLSHEGDAVGTLMIIDIDHFKEINDSYGHVIGDNVIHEFGQLLKRSCRETDIVGRVGGDEFYVFYKEINEQKIISEKAEFILHECQKIGDGISCSIGIAFYPQDTYEFDELYQYADQALYVAKGQGRSRYCFYGDTKEKD